MSAVIKLNLTLMTATVSIIIACGSIIWYASAKASSIDAVQVSLTEAVKELRKINDTVVSLDERYRGIAKAQESLETRLEKIASAIGTR